MDTIVAIATPPGRGGVGIVRISGPNSYSLGIKLSNLNHIKPRQAIYVPFFIDKEIVDQGIIIYFKAPHSFTGEDIIEIQAHGSPIVLDKIIKTCIGSGLARIANPGEFSERAFLNDKIDLAQAEAIADLISASSETAAKLAMRSLQGEFSKKITELADKIIYLRLYVEAAIDFPDEEIDFLADGKVSDMLSNIIQNLNVILKEAHCGAIIREGLNIVIAGSPNAGKSTLINYLAGRDVAIVTDIAGTTRDVMREHVIIDDLPLNIIDTAGIRESHDVIEQEGIKRALVEISRADLVLLITDINDKDSPATLNSYIQSKLPQNTPTIHVYNKIDTINNLDKTNFAVTSSEQPIYISAKSGTGVENLIAKIKNIVSFQPAEGQFLARRRHLEALDATKRLLLAGENALRTNLSGELLAEDLRLAHQELTKITGEFSADELLGAIFSSFCIGK
jgi:tRNA modification GTPase